LGGLNFRCMLIRTHPSQRSRTLSLNCFLIFFFPFFAPSFSFVILSRLPAPCSLRSFSLMPAPNGPHPRSFPHVSPYARWTITSPPHGLYPPHPHSRTHEPILLCQLPRNNVRRGMTLCIAPHGPHYIKSLPRLTAISIPSSIKLRTAILDALTWTKVN
jgi:hypothetical protein